MQLDWSQVVQNISIIIASGVAIYGITSWRREFVGRRRIELAEEVLALFYEARDKISAIRSAVGFEGEGSARKQNPNERPEEKRILDNAYVVFERYQKNQEVFNKLHSLRYRFMAKFGRKAAEPFDGLEKIVGEILLSARRLSRYWLRQGNDFRTEEDFQRHIEGMHTAEAIFWEDAEDPDPLRPRIDAVIEEIEKRCRAIIDPQHTLRSRLRKRYPGCTFFRG